MSVGLIKFMTNRTLDSDETKYTNPRFLCTFPNTQILVQSEKCKHHINKLSVVLAGFKVNNKNT